MKNLLIASVVALAAIMPFATPSSAASVTVTTKERVVHGPGYHVVRKAHYQDCFTKKVRIREHGRVIVKTTRVCR